MGKKTVILNKYEIMSSGDGGYGNLGFGAYGMVQLGKCMKNQQTVAIKKIYKKIALN
jgi:hypothetical protein